MTEAIKAEIAVTSFRRLEKGETLKGFLTLTLDSGLVPRDCAYHKRSDGSSWISPPAKEFTTANGQKAWNPIVSFIDKQTYQRFQKGALAAIDRYFAAQPAESASVTEADVDWTLGGKR